MTSISQNQHAAQAAAPARDWLKLMAILAGLVGLAVSIYLTYTKLFNTEVFCPVNSGFNCDLVQNSVYSRVVGIPVQFLGLAGYLAILGVLLLEGRVGIFTERGPLLVFGMSLFGFLFSAYLTSIEAFVLHAWCIYCVVSALAMTVLFILSLARLLRTVNTLADATADSGDEE